MHLSVDDHFVPSRIVPENLARAGSLCNGLDREWLTGLVAMSLAFPSAASWHSPSFEKYLISHENGFQQDERDDYLLKAQRTLSVDNVRQDLSGVGDHGQLTG